METLLENTHSLMRLISKLSHSCCSCCHTLIFLASPTTCTHRDILIYIYMLLGYGRP